MIEDFDALEDYPVLDDDDHSEVMCEAENYAWESYTRRDFHKALAEKFSEHDLTDLNNDQLDILFYELCDRTNTCWEHETGNSAFIRLERVVEGATEQDITSKEAL